MPRRPFRTVLRTLVPPLLLTVGLSLSTAATTTTPDMDIPKLAADFAKKVGLVDLASCTTKAVDGTRFVCHAVTVQGAALPPISFFCEGAIGCWIPPAPDSKSSSN